MFIVATWLYVSLALTARFSSLATNTCCVQETHKRFLSLTTIFSIQYARNSFSSLKTEDKISFASDKSRAVCARR